MFFSLVAYLFLAFIYNEIHTHYGKISLISTTDCLKDININYAVRGRSVAVRLECKSDTAETIRKTMKLEDMIKD
jgi:hypothetical protein